MELVTEAEGVEINKKGDFPGGTMYRNVSANAGGTQI